MTAPQRQQEQLRMLLGGLADPAVAGRLPTSDSGLVELARHHRLTPLLSAERSAALPAALAEIFRRDRLVTVARNLMLARAAEECVSAFATAGIETIVLKGLDYGVRLYGAGARVTADIDLLVPGASRRTAFTILDRLGFEPRAAAPGFDDPDYHEVAWTRQGVEVDLHLALAPLARCRIDYAAVWRDAEPLRLGDTDTRALARSQAAVFHALHMAIDHFAIPAVYLVDLIRLLPGPAEQDAALQLASRWHCLRPLATAMALSGAFVPNWAATTSAHDAAVATRVIAGYGPSQPLPRSEQLLRKMLHFDSPWDAARYIAVQARRNLREAAEAHLRRRSARERLGMARGG